jgi:hypothetical protein
LGAIADRSFGIVRTLPKLHGTTRAKGGGLPGRNGSYQALIEPRWRHGPFSGKVAPGFPIENATTQGI